MSFLRIHLPRLGWRTQLAFGKRASNYCHALLWHLLVDDEKRTMTWSFVLPGWFAWVTEHPTPGWRKLAVWLSHGAGEQARYGFQHTCHELELFWRRVINLPNRTARGGWSWLHLWPVDPSTFTVVSMTDLSGQVAEEGKAWATKEGLTDWRFGVWTRVLPSRHWWIPDEISHRYALTSRDVPGQAEWSCLQERTFERPSLAEAFAKVSTFASQQLAKLRA